MAGPYTIPTWHALQVYFELSEHRVIIPFAKVLAELTSAIATRLRRDFELILNLIRAHAILHQATRERDSEGRIIATLKDYETVYCLVKDILAEAVESGIPLGAAETVEAVSKYVDQSGPHETVSMSQLARAMKLDRSTVSRRVAVCLEHGWLKNLENNDHKAAKLCIGDPLPEPQAILPEPQQLLEAVELAAFKTKEATPKPESQPEKVFVRSL